MTRAQAPAEGEWRREFDGAVQEIGLSLVWLAGIARELDLPADQAYALELCAEELIANVVLHNSGTPPVHVRLTLAAEAGRLLFTVEDNGALFDIASAPEKRAEGPLDELVPGGLGVGLIKRFASSLKYERTPYGNRVEAGFIGDAGTQNAMSKE